MTSNLNTNDKSSVELFANTVLDICQATMSIDHYEKLLDSIDGYLSSTQSKIELDALEQQAEISNKHLEQEIENSTKGSVLNRPLFELSNFTKTVCETENSRYQKFRNGIFIDDATRIQKWMEAAYQNDKRPQLFRAQQEQKAELTLYFLVHHEDQFAIFEAQNDITTQIESLLKDNFKISSSEIIIIRGLIRGLSLNDLARETGKSIETIRSQFKTAAGKIGLSRQTEVTSLVYNISNASKYFSPDENPITTGGFKLSDGRNIQYEILGDPNGKPVFFIHDYANGRHWPAHTIVEFKRRNLCVYSVSRAGFGESTPVHKTGLELLDQTVCDLEEIIRENGIRKFQFLCFGTGFAVGYRFALKHPDMVDKIVGIDIYPPILSRKDIQHFPAGFYRSSILAAKYIPKTHEVLSKIAAKRAKLATNYQELERMVGLKMFPEVGAEELFETVVKRNLQDLASSRFEGAWRDATWVTKDWALMDQKLNSRPVAIVMHHPDFPSLNVEVVKDFSEKLEIPFEVINQKFRFLFGETDVIFEYL